MLPSGDGDDVEVGDDDDDQVQQQLLPAMGGGEGAKVRRQKAGLQNVIDINIVVILVVVIIIVMIMDMIIDHCRRCIFIMLFPRLSLLNTI